MFLHRARGRQREPQSRRHRWCRCGRRAGRNHRPPVRPGPRGCRHWRRCRRCRRIGPRRRQGRRGSTGATRGWLLGPSRRPARLPALPIRADDSGRREASRRRRSRLFSRVVTEKRTTPGCDCHDGCTAGAVFRITCGKFCLSRCYPSSRRATQDDPSGDPATLQDPGSRGNEPRPGSVTGGGAWVCEPCHRGGFRRTAFHTTSYPLMSQRPPGITWLHPPTKKLGFRLE